jgi:hypothetical protein
MYTSRKFNSAWVLTLLLVLLLITGNIDQVVFGSIFSILWSSYFTANVATKFVNKGSN